jgi:hypothetical protein
MKLDKLDPKLEAQIPEQLQKVRQFYFEQLNEKDSNNISN